MGSQNYIRGPCATWTPLAEKNYTQIDHFTISNCIFNFNFLAVNFPRYKGGSRIYTRGPMHPRCPYRRNFRTQSEYFTISNCVFNFNFLALRLYKILGWSQIYIRGRRAAWMPPCEKIFIPKKNTFAYLIAVLIPTV